MESVPSNFNLTLNGCGLWPLAPVFEDSENGGAQPRRFIRHPLSGFLFILIRHPFQTYPKTVVPGHLRSGQVTLTPEMFVTLQKLRFFSDNMNIIRPSVPTKRSFSDFRFRWPKARSIFWHPYQKAMGETLTPSYIRIRSNYFTLNGIILHHCWWSRFQFWSVAFIEVIWSHLRPPTGFCQ